MRSPQGADRSSSSNGKRTSLTNGEIVGGSYGIQCNQSNTTTSGPFTRVVGATKSLACGLGLTEAIAGARTYVCRGARTLHCGGAYSEAITGGKRSGAGAVNEHAGGNLGTSASFGEVSCGSAELQAGATFSIEAPSVTLDVSGSLVAEALTMSGGVFKVTSGHITVSGNVSRKGGGKVG